MPIAIAPDGLERIRLAAVDIGKAYPHPWAPTTEIAAAIRPGIAQVVNQELAGVPRRLFTPMMFVGLGLLVAGVVTLAAYLSTASVAETTDGRTLQPNTLTPIFCLLLSAGITLMVLAVMRWDGGKERQELCEGALSAALEAVREERGARPRGPAPAPQPYGVSHDGAERLVAEWMRHLGEPDAEATRFVGDGGIDVASSRYIAQVKNYTGSVGVAEIREMAGVASIDGRKAIFFTSGTFAPGAATFAERAGIGLFRYDAVAGTLSGEDDIALNALKLGL